ncbi:MAG: phosphoribosylformylglycinamidine synthase subunit PurQ [Candidatus Caldatribacteriaceae bacterium]
MRFGVVVFPGSNCDYDCFYVLKDVLRQDVVFLWHQEENLRGCDCVILPGGFSYGDYLRTGAIARFSPIMRAVQDFVLRGGIVLGICNGFQILLEGGLLPGALLPNRDGRFVCRYVFLRVENTNTPFTLLFSPGEVIRIPIAHYQGNFFLPEEELSELERHGQVIFRYCGPLGEVDVAFNPNGSVGNIAGVASLNFRVMGMMPHPERASEDLLGSSDGQRIFLSIAKWCEEERSRACS